MRLMCDLLDIHKHVKLSGDFHTMKNKNNSRNISPMILFTVGLLLAPIVEAGAGGVAYVSNQNGKVLVIDLDTKLPKSEFNLGANGPRGIGISADGRWLVTANKDSSNISIVDTSGASAPLLVNIGKNPEFVRILGDMAYVTYEPGSKSGPPVKNGTNSPKEDDDDDEKIPGHIAIVDIKQAKVIKDITGKPETEGLEFSPDGMKMIVTNESDNSITVHDIKSGKLLKSISVGKYGERPRGIKVSPDGKTYVVTLELSDKMLVLNDRFKVIREIATGKAPYGVSFDKEGNRIFVAANKEKSLQVFDAKTFQKIQDIPTGERCWHFTFTPDYQEIFLACGKSSEVIVIDTNKLVVTNRIPNKEMPWGIVTYPKSMGSIDQP
jgi:DNA-binding beta-propeller fold protein YncE